MHRHHPPAAALPLLLAGLLAGCDGGRGAAPGANAPAPAPTLPATQPHQAGVRLGPDLVTVGVGERCTPCHEDIARAYTTSGMHDSLTLPSGAGSIEAGLVGTEVRLAPNGMTARFDVRDGRYVQRLYYVDPLGVERVAYEAPIDLVVGSGHATRSYFTVRDGRMLQLPLTWYRELGGLALSPGPGFAERTLRVADTLCVVCHTGAVRPVRNDAGVGFHGQVSLGVTCERCHGPSDQHCVTGDVRDTVNPARLPPEQQEQVCLQCHLSAGITMESTERTIVDYVPGTPLADYLGIFGLADAGPAAHTEIAGHASRLRLSRCYTESRRGDDGAGLTCTTCHNPHRGFRAGDTARETDRGCLTCHAGDDCHAEPAQRGDAPCFSCHMGVTPAGDVAHTRVTDHWIRKRVPDPGASARHLPHAGELAVTGAELVNVLDPELTRPGSTLLLARAYARGAEMAKATLRKDATAWRERAFELAGRHLERFPSDAEALRVRGRMLTLAGRTADARALLERAVELQGDIAAPWAELGYSHAEASRYVQAEEYLAKAAELDPYDEDVAAAHARLLVEAERRAEAFPALAAVRERLGPSILRGKLASDIALYGKDGPEAVRNVYDVLLFEPLSPDVNTHIADLLLALGDKERARAHLEVALRSDPNFKAALELLEQTR
mgnify:CR=1 FL=1